MQSSRASRRTRPRSASSRTAPPSPSGSRAWARSWRRRGSCSASTARTGVKHAMFDNVVVPRRAWMFTRRALCSRPAVLAVGGPGPGAQGEQERADAADGDLRRHLEHLPVGPRARQERLRRRRLRRRALQHLVSPPLADDFPRRYGWAASPHRRPDRLPVDDRSRWVASSPMPRCAPASRRSRTCRSTGSRIASRT